MPKLSMVLLYFFVATYGLAQLSPQNQRLLARFPVRCNILDKQNHRINQANGFVIEHNHHLYFITNYHIISDTNYYSGTVHPFYDNGSIAEPWALDLRMHRKKENAWTFSKLPLFINGKPAFFRMKFSGKLADIMAIQIHDTGSFQFEPVEYLVEPPYSPGNGDLIYLAGYPLPLKDGPAIRVGKVLETDSVPTTRQGKLPMYLIDLSSPGWYSGSPAFFWNPELNKPVLVGIIGNADEEENTGIWRIDFLREMIVHLP